MFKNTPVAEVHWQKAIQTHQQPDAQTPLTNALRQVSNPSSPVVHLLQQQPDQPLPLPSFHPTQTDVMKTHADTYPIRNAVLSSVWDPRSQPLAAPTLLYAQQRHAVQPATVNREGHLIPPLAHQYGIKRGQSQAPGHKQTYCRSAEMIQKQQMTAEKTGKPRLPGQSPATGRKRAGRPAQTTTANTQRTEAWVHTTVINRGIAEQEQAFCCAETAIMKDVAATLKQHKTPFKAIQQTVPGIFQQMALMMPSVIEQQFITEAAQTPLLHFPDGMQYTAADVLATTITLKAKARTDGQGTEASQLQEMSRLNNKISELKRKLKVSAGEEHWRHLISLHRTQSQYDQYLITLFPQYHCLRSLSQARVPARVNAVINYCNQLYATETAAQATAREAAAKTASVRSQPPLPSQESSTLSQASAFTPSLPSTGSQKATEAGSPPLLSPVHSLSENPSISSLQSPPTLTQIQNDAFLPPPAVQDAEVQTDDLPADNEQVSDTEAAGVRHAEVQTDETLYDEEHSDEEQDDEVQIIAVRRAERQADVTGQRLLINLDRRTSDSSQTIASSVPVSPAPFLSGRPQPADFSADERTFGTALLMWESMVQQLQHYGQDILENRFSGLISYLSLPLEKWLQLAGNDGLSNPGRQMLNVWKSKRQQPVTEAEKTLWLQAFDKYLARRQQGWMTTDQPMRLETAPQANPVITFPAQEKRASAGQQQEIVIIPDAPNLSLLANIIHDQRAWMEVCFEAMPPMIVRSHMYSQKRTTLVIVTADNLVHSVYSATSSHAIPPAELLHPHSLLRQCVAVVRYINQNHYFAWRSQGSNVQFGRHPEYPGRIIFDSAGCELRNTVTPGFCLTEAAALAEPGNRHISEPADIVRIGNTLRRQVRTAISRLPLTNRELMASLEDHLAAQQMAAEEHH
ncbi:hypothetical protein [Erwinia sp. V71]|uniref:hypothetical protein n=1 Tax=Erwinia sp. V71 TaxID=3369424 RepID=UPI003F639D42